MNYFPHQCGKPTSATEVINIKRDQLIGELQQLSVEELQLLYAAVLKQLAIPLQNPELFYDDWDDTGVDALYAKSW